MIFRAKNGAQILERIDISEDEALIRFPDLNHALVIVRAEGDYLLGFHRWRDDWETFGGLIEPGETLRECIVRECEEELGITDIEFDYLGVVRYYMPPDYWVREWHEESGGLYGISLPAGAVQRIEEKRNDKDEIGGIELYSRLKERGENIDEINERLLKFYQPEG